jgi:hypothetical protein
MSIQRIEDVETERNLLQPELGESVDQKNVVSELAIRLRTVEHPGQRHSETRRQ